MPTIRIGDRLVGEGQPVYIIAEAGINHNGDPAIARQLIEVAVEARAEAVKFQKRALDQLYPRSLLEELAGAEKELQFLIPFLQAAELSDSDMAAMAQHARSRGIQFLCTPWDEPSVDFLETLGVEAYKVASADLPNLFLLERLAQTGKPLIVSTGMSRWEEIERSVGFLQERGVQFALLHCQSTYPAPFGEVHLRFMERLRQFGVPVGYSGHERGIAVSTCAAALGACIIERHITLDRTMRGPDHAASIEPAGMIRQVRDIRALEESLGSASRPLSRGELLNRHALGKSLAAARPIAAGEVITREHLQARGPGLGLSPQRAEELIGRVSRRALAEGEQFRESDLLEETPEQMAAGFPLRWGLVARYHDAPTMAALHPQVLEFHLTDQDLDATLPDLGEFPQEPAVHAPEYYQGRLLDLCSAEEKARRGSLDVMLRVCDRAREMSRHFPQHAGPIKVIVHPGGMSYDEFVADTRELQENLARSAEELYAQEGVENVLENLPPLPWYLGGQWYSNVFVKPQEIAAFCALRGAQITLDLSHAQLWCNLTGADMLEYVRAVKPHIRHLHVADASGTDGEALQIGEGEMNWPPLVAELKGIEAAWIPEIWLGHRNEGEGFLVALKKLSEMVG